MPYVCWFLWWADDIEDFKWRLHFQYGVALWRVALGEVYFEGHWGLQSWILVKMVGANQPVHWFLGGKGLGIQQGMSVWVGSPKSSHDPSDSKSNRLCVDIFWFCFIHLGHILKIPLKWSVILLKSPTSTGSSIPNRQFFPYIRSNP